MTRTLSRWILVLGLVLACSHAHARIIGGYVGAGPRILEDDWEPMGSAHAYLNLESMLDLTADLHWYVSGPEETVTTIAGGSVGLNWLAPIPGPIGAEVGVTGGAIQRNMERHGADDVLPVFTYEFAATLALGPVRFRGSYQSAFGSPSGTARQLFGTMFLVMAGIGI